MSVEGPLDRVNRRALVSSLLALALCVYVGLHVVQFLTMQLALLDEPVNLVDAMLIRQGLRPHVDFWTMYPALNYRLNAVAFGVLGPSVIAERLVQTAIYALLLVGWFLYLRRGRRLTTPWALGWTLFAAIAIGASFTNYSFNGLAFSFGGLLLALPVLDGRVRRPLPWLVASGTVVGIGALTKLNFGGYVGVAIGATLVLDAFDPEHRRGWVGRCVAFAVPVLVVLGAYALQYRDALALLWDDMIAFPGEHLEPHRILALAADPAGVASAVAIAAPFVWIALRRIGTRAGVVAAAVAIVVTAGTLRVGVVWPGALPRVFVVATAVLLVWQCTSARLGRTEFVVWLGFTLFGHYFLSRADRFHYHAMVPFAALLGPVALDHAIAMRPAGRWLAVAFVGFLTLPVGAWDQAWLARRVPTLVSAELSALDGARELLARGDSAVLMAPGATPNPLASRLFRDRDEIAAARYVHERSAPDEPIYVGLRDHADVFMCPTRTYWVVGRRPGVRRHMLEPGMTTEPAIQREMIGELERHGVRWIVLRQNLDGDASYEARGYRGADQLDAHIRARFREVAVYGPWAVWRRVDA